MGAAGRREAIREGEGERERILNIWESFMLLKNSPFFILAYIMHCGWVAIMAMDGRRNEKHHTVQHGLMGHRSWSPCRSMQF